MKGLIALLAVFIVLGFGFLIYSSRAAPPERSGTTIMPYSRLGQVTEAERAQIQAEVMSWTDQWIEWTRNLDADGVMALFDPDEARYVMNATFYSGWDECRNAFETLYRGWETWDPSWSGRSVEVLGAEVAFLIGQVRGPLTPVDGTEGINQVRLTFLLNKRADGWKAVYGHGSGVFTPNPPAEG